MYLFLSDTNVFTVDVHRHQHAHFCLPLYFGKSCVELLQNQPTLNFGSTFDELFKYLQNTLDPWLSTGGTRAPGDT